MLDAPGVSLEVEKIMEICLFDVSFKTHGDFQTHGHPTMTNPNSS